MGSYTESAEVPVPATIAYFDCFSGASGDMLLGALLDAGLVLSDLEDDLAELGLADCGLEVTRQVRKGISGTKLDVVDKGSSRPVRHLSDVRRILEGAKLATDIVERSLSVFTRLAEAEAAIHGTTIEEVHFHEVGAVDALADIVGFCIGMHRLGMERIYSSPLPLGTGRVRTEHGLLPVPAPATLALLASAGAPTIPSEGQGEMVTPTGAALLTSLAEFTRPAMRIQSVGYGFGTKEFPWANVVRVWIGEELSGTAPGSRSAEGHSHDHDAHHDHSHTHPHDEDDGPPGDTVG